MPDLRINVFAETSQFRQKMEAEAVRAQRFGSAIKNLSNAFTESGSTVTKVTGTLLQYQTQTDKAKNAIRGFVDAQGKSIGVQRAAAESGLLTQKAYLAQIQALDLLIEKGRLDVVQTEQAKQIREGLVSTLERLTGAYLQADGSIRFLSDAQRKLRDASIGTTAELVNATNKVKDLAKAARESGDPRAMGQVIEQIRSIEAEVRKLGDTPEALGLQNRLRQIREATEDLIPPSQRLAEQNIKTARSFQQDLQELNRSIALYDQAGISTEQLRRQKIALIATYQDLTKRHRADADALDEETTAQERLAAAGIRTTEDYQTRLDELTRRLEDARNVRLDEDTLGDPVAIGHITEQIEQLKNAQNRYASSSRRMTQDNQILQKELANLSTEVAHSQQAYQAQERAVKLSNFALGNAAFILQDMAQFQFGVGQGVRAIANNIQGSLLSWAQLTDLVKSLNVQLAAAGEQTLPVARTAFKLLIRTAGGPLGILLIANAATTLFALLNKEGKSAAGNVDNITDSFQDLIDVSKDLGEPFRFATDQDIRFAIRELEDFRAALRDPFEQLRILRLETRQFDADLGRLSPGQAKKTLAVLRDGIRETSVAAQGALAVIPDVASEYQDLFADLRRAAQDRVKFGKSTSFLQALQDELADERGAARELRDELEKSRKELRKRVVLQALVRKALTDETALRGRINSIIREQSAELDSVLVRQRVLNRDGLNIVGIERSKDAQEDLNRLIEDRLALEEQITSSVNSRIPAATSERAGAVEFARLASSVASLANIDAQRIRTLEEANSLLQQQDDITREQARSQAAAVRRLAIQQEIRLGLLKLEADLQESRLEAERELAVVQSDQGRSLNEQIGYSEQLIDLAKELEDLSRARGRSSVNEGLIFRTQQQTALEEIGLEREALLTQAGQESLILEQLVEHEDIRIDTIREQAKYRNLLAISMREEVSLLREQNITEATRLFILQENRDAVLEELTAQEQIADNIERQIELEKSRQRGLRAVREEVRFEVEELEESVRLAQLRLDALQEVPGGVRIPAPREERQIPEQEKATLNIEKAQQQSVRLLTASIGLDSQRNTLLEQIKSALSEEPEPPKVEFEATPEVKVVSGFERPERETPELPFLPPTPRAVAVVQDEEKIEKADEAVENLASSLNETADNTRAFADAFAETFGLTITSLERSRKDIERLKKEGAPVAEDSLHLEGRAFDIAPTFPQGRGTARGVEKLKEAKILAEELNKQLGIFEEIILHGEGQKIHLHVALKEGVAQQRQLADVTRQSLQYMADQESLQVRITEGIEESAQSQRAAGRYTRDAAGFYRQFEDAVGGAAEAGEELGQVQKDIAATGQRLTGIQRIAWSLIRQQVISSEEQLGILREQDSFYRGSAATDKTRNEIIKEAVLQWQLGTGELREQNRQLLIQIGYLDTIEGKSDLLARQREQVTNAAAQAQLGRTDPFSSFVSAGDFRDILQSFPKEELDEILEKFGSLRNFTELGLDLTPIDQWGKEWTDLSKTIVAGMEDGQNAVRAFADTMFTTVEGVQFMGDIMGNVAGNFSSMFRDMFEAGDKENKKYWKLFKGFAVAEAIVNTLVAATMALRQGGPIFGPILAASVLAAGYGQVRKIMAMEPGKTDTGSSIGPLVDRFGIITPGNYGPISRDQEAVTQAKPSQQIDQPSSEPIPVTFVQAADSLSLPALQVDTAEFSESLGQMFAPQQQPPAFEPSKIPIEVTIRVEGESRIEGKTLVTAISREVTSQLNAGLRNPLQV